MPALRLSSPRWSRNRSLSPSVRPGTSRYRLLETVRLYANGRLVELGLADDARRRDAQLYLDQARSWPVADPFTDLDVIDVVISELADIGTAIDWLTVQGAHSEAAELVVLCGGCLRLVFQPSRRRGSGPLRPHIESECSEPHAHFRRLRRGMCRRHHLTGLGRRSTRARRRTTVRRQPSSATCGRTAYPGRARCGISAFAQGPRGGARLRICAPRRCRADVDQHGSVLCTGTRSSPSPTNRTPQPSAAHEASAGPSRPPSRCHPPRRTRRRDEALALLARPLDVTLPPPSTTTTCSDSPSRPSPAIPDTVAPVARTTITEVDRLRDVVWRGELVVILGIAHTQSQPI